MQFSETIPSELKVYKVTILSDKTKFHLRPGLTLDLVYLFCAYGPKCCILPQLLSGPLHVVELGGPDGWQSQLFDACVHKRIGIPTILKSSIVQVESLLLSYMRPT